MMYVAAFLFFSGLKLVLLSALVLELGLRRTLNDLRHYAPDRHPIIEGFFKVIWVGMIGIVCGICIAFTSWLVGS